MDSILYTGNVARISLSYVLSYWIVYCWCTWYCSLIIFTINYIICITYILSFGMTSFALSFKYCSGLRIWCVILFYRPHSKALMARCSRWQPRRLSYRILTRSQTAMVMTAEGRSCRRGNSLPVSATFHVYNRAYSTIHVYYEVSPCAIRFMDVWEHDYASHVSLCTILYPGYSSR